MARGRNLNFNRTWAFFGLLLAVASPVVVMADVTNTTITRHDVVGEEPLYYSGALGDITLSQTARKHYNASTAVGGNTMTGVTPENVDLSGSANTVTLTGKSYDGVAKYGVTYYQIHDMAMQTLNIDSLSSSTGNINDLQNIKVANLMSTTTTSGGSGSAGTQISGAEFASAQLNVADGGSLSIQNSTINLAEESAMEKYFGKNSLLYQALCWPLAYIQHLNCVMTQWVDSTEQVLGTYYVADYVTTIAYPYMAVPAGYQIENEKVVNAGYIERYVSIPVFLGYHLSAIQDLLRCYIELWSRWFYPLKSSEPLYWRYYNTDTGQAESISLGGLMYNISWYLGNMYQLNTWDANAGEQLSKPIAELNQQITSAIDNEDAVLNQANNYLSSWDPNLDVFGGLVSIGWLGTYLTYLYNSLGEFSIIPTFAFLIAFCKLMLQPLATVVVASRFGTRVPKSRRLTGGRR